jgi:hypothetical protein
MFKVYVAGPYTKGDVAVNVKNAIEAADKLAQLGFAPYVPHLVHLWHMMYPQSYDFWCRLDNEFVVLCDAVLLLPGESAGAEAEVALAERSCIPVFKSIQELLDHMIDRVRSKTNGYVTITVNGTKWTKPRQEMSYAEIVLLANDKFSSNVAYTVVCDDGDRGRTMSFGDSVFIGDGMKFSVALTNAA